MIRLCFLVLTVFCYCWIAEASWYSNNEYGFSIFMPTGFREEMPTFTNPKSKVIMGGYDYSDQSNMSISVSKTEFSPSRDQLEAALPFLANNLIERGANVYGKGVFVVNPLHYGIYLKYSFLVKGMMLNFVQGWIWIHGNEYIVTYTYSSQCGRENEMINSLYTFTCNLCK